MRKKFWENNEEALLVITAILIVIGSVNIFSASFVRADIDYDNQYFFLARHLRFVVLGAVILWIVSRVPYRKWKNWSVGLIMVTLVCLVAVALFGVEVNGSKRWLNIGFQFQPSELAKLAVILFTSGYLGNLINKNRPITVLNKSMGIVMVIAAIVFLQPDLGTAAIIFALPFGMHVIAGLRHLVRWIFLAAAALGLATIAQPYRLQRLAVWFDPWSDPSDRGYQTIQSIIAIGSGGLLGEGLGMGVSKFSYLPEAHTDFAFAVLCQEMGSVGVAIVFFLLVAFFVYGIQIAMACRDGQGKILAVGIVMLITGQSVSNMAMVCGLLPVIGVPLPFISYGGTSLLVNMFAVGILINIGRCNENNRRREEDNPDGGEEQPKPRVRTRLRVVKKGA